MQNKALIYALYVINSQFASNMHNSKQLVNSENLSLIYMFSCLEKYI